MLKYLALMFLLSAPAHGQALRQIGGDGAAAGLGGVVACTNGQFMNLDLNTLYVDCNNNRVGIGITNPTGLFAVGGSTSTNGLLVATATGTYMLGVTDGGKSAPAGYVGEYISTNTATTLTPATSGTAITLATTTLTTGIWAIYASCFEDTGATTAQTRQWCSISNVGNGQDSTQSDAHQQNAVVVSASAVSSFTIGPRIVAVTGPTAYYLTGLLVYSVLGGATWSTKSTLQAIRIR